MSTSSDLEQRVDEAVVDLQEYLDESEGKELAAQADRDRQGFEQLAEGRYRWRGGGIELEVDYLRREGHQLKGEIAVRTWIPGASTGEDGLLAIEDLNLSSTRTRTALGRYLASRAKLKDFDWTGLVERFCQRVLAAERRGSPAVWLDEVAEAPPDETLEVLGWRLLAHHPQILFGDGGTCKSYLALYVAGTLAQRGRRVGYIDWELDGPEHRRRLGLLFGEQLPRIAYVRCSRPLVHEADRLRRIVREQELEYLVVDSIGFACDGPPESAEVAGRFFQALRSLGEVGSLLLAHITKSLEGADRRPFGSAFWHNGARSTWNVKTAEATPDDTTVSLALHHCKANLGPLRPSVGLEFSFGAERTAVRRINVAESRDLAAQLPVAERVRLALRSRPLTRQQLQLELEDVSDDTLRRTINREKKRGRVLEFPHRDGSRLSLSAPEPTK